MSHYQRRIHTLKVEKNAYPLTIYHIYRRKDGTLGNPYFVTLFRSWHARKSKKGR